MLLISFTISVQPSLLHKPLELHQLELNRRFPLGGLDTSEYFLSIGGLIGEVRGKRIVSLPDL